MKHESEVADVIEAAFEWKRDPKNYTRHALGFSMFSGGTRSSQVSPPRTRRRGEMRRVLCWIGVHRWDSTKHPSYAEERR